MFFFFNALAERVEREWEFGCRRRVESWWRKRERERERKRERERERERSSR